MLRIGEFARLNGLTVKTLRNYDLRGVFAPAWTDPQTGYRYYSPTQLPDLRRVMALRELGIPLNEVAELVAEGSDLRVALDRRRGELENTRSAIESKLAALDIRVEMGSDGPDVVLRRVDEQLVATLPLGDKMSATFYELESAVRDANARASLPPGSIYPTTGESGQPDLFVPVTRAVDEGRVTSRRLDATRVAAVIHRGPYDTLNDAYGDLLTWMKAAGLEKKDAVRVLYLSFGAEPELNLPHAFLAGSATEYVTEIQIPV